MTEAPDDGRCARCGQDTDSGSHRSVCGHPLKPIAADEIAALRATYEDGRVAALGFATVARLLNEIDRLTALLTAEELASEAAETENDRVRDLLARATRFTFGPTGPFDHPHAAIDAAADVNEGDESAIHIEGRPGLGPNLAAVTRWSVSCAGWVRTHAGRWVHEPIPGERTEKFMRATRWQDQAAAVATAEKLVAAGHPELPEWKTGRRHPMREEDLDA